jgi:hypothetical protein
MNGCSTTRDIPHVRAYPAAGPDDSCHLGNGLAGVGEERDDESHDGNIETVIAKGKRLRITDAELRRLCSGPRSRKRELALRRIDTNNFGRSTTSDECRGEGAVATAYIKPSHIRRNVEPVQENFAGESTPTTHESLIGFSIRK